MRLSLDAVMRMRAATIAAPKPLSMLTTDTPGELETRADSRGNVAPSGMAFAAVDLLTDLSDTNCDQRYSSKAANRLTAYTLDLLDVSRPARSP
ncbi:MAG: hypothetical protein FRX49_01924 [Trebouxia sp. A1-2]|nr:MAG: hypothetical protein FRX49_01924 [Trebouxia sp. A1-2]